MEWSSASDKGLERETNEDDLLVCPDVGLYAVADGIGGHRAGEVASQLALQCLEEVVRNDATDPLTALVTASQEANQRIQGAGRDNPKYSGMGTTLTACVIQTNTLYWVHIGDSRGYLLRDNKISQFTEDHSMVYEMVRQGEITAEEADVHPYRNVLSRALGTEAVVLVDTGTVTLQKHDVVLLCSDGLTIHLRPGEILRVLERGTIEEQAGELIRLALERGGKDNVTVVLIGISGCDSE